MVINTLAQTYSSFIYSSASPQQKELAHDYFPKILAKPKTKISEIMGYPRCLFWIPFLNKMIAEEGLARLVEENHDVLLLKHSTGVDEKVIGHLAYQKSPKEIYVCSLMLHPNFQGYGLSYFLENNLISHARKQGIERIKFGDSTHPFFKEHYRKLLERESLSHIEGNTARII